MSDRRPSRSPLVTPILLKRSPRYAWPPGQRMHYLLARDGLYRCRDEEFFRSCVRTTSGPGELETQQPFFEPRFPLLPRALFERAVGFFERIADLHGSEAAALLVWDRQDACVRLLVPPQLATVQTGWNGHRYPIGVHYTPPHDLPPHQVPFGDIHSHVDQGAWSSQIDREDESHSAGLHIVVGRIRSEPPEVHVEAVVDGQRFVLPPDRVIEAYQRRRHDVPATWIERVRVESSSWWTWAGTTTPTGRAPGGAE